jgi:hypothetical protein
LPIFDRNLLNLPTQNIAYRLLTGKDLAIVLANDISVSNIQKINILAKNSMVIEVKS